MPTYGRTSQNRLESCHPDIQKVMHEVIKHVDVSIVEGHRSKETQFEYFMKGRKEVGPGVFKVYDRSKVITNVDGKNIEGKHNKNPSHALDFVPWVPGIGADWKNTTRFMAISFFILGIAMNMGIRLKSGADWDGDFYSNDQKLRDVPHLELDAKLVDGVWVKY